MPGREGGQAQRQRRLTRSRACAPLPSHARADDLSTRNRAREGGAVHAYVLMTNHVHLLMTPGVAGRTGRTAKHGNYRKLVMQAVGPGETTSSDGMLESRLPPRLLINAPPPKATRCSSPVGGSRSQPLSANGCVLVCRASRIRTLTRPFESATRSRFARLSRWERGKHVTCCGGIRRRRRTVFQSLSGPRISHRRSSALS